MDRENHAGLNAASPLRRRGVVLLAICGALGACWWWMHGSTVALQRTVNAADAAAVRMRSDAAVVLALQQAPKRAVDVVRPSEELLSQVDRALDEAGITKSVWRDSVPMPPQRDAGSGFVQYTTRLYFEGMTVKQAAGLIHTLLDRDPILRVSAFQLTGDGDAQVWNLEAAISYKFYSPQL